jgi:hypothetical protein
MCGFKPRGEKMTNKVVPPIWSELDVSNLARGFREGTPVCDIAGFLLRTEDDVRGKARDLGIAFGVS